MKTADLTFNILEQRLSGAIDGQRINASAVSGGRAGSKTEGAVNPLLANNPYLSGVKLSKDTPGGTLPIGRYYLKTHEKKENWIRVLPVKGQNMKKRDGFAIHGRGKRGSDGCIVPMDFHNVQQIAKLCKAREMAGEAAPVLDVVAIGDADEPLNRIKLWQTIA
jgi:hypothetical protein